MEGFDSPPVSSTQIPSSIAKVSHSWSGSFLGNTGNGMCVSVEYVYLPFFLANSIERCVCDFDVQSKYFGELKKEKKNHRHTQTLWPNHWKFRNSDLIGLEA